MSLSMWDNLYNVLILGFWIVLWTGRDSTFARNLYLRRFHAFCDSLIGFLRPAFPGMPTRAVAALAVIALVFLRGVILSDVFGPLSRAGDLAWDLRHGFLLRTAPKGHVFSGVVFSSLSFGVFLFKIGSFSLLYAARRNGDFEDDAQEAVGVLARPFTALRTEWRPLVLLIAGTGLSFLLRRVGHAPAPVAVERVGALLPVLASDAVVALAALVDILRTVQSFLFLLIIGSWVSLLTGFYSLATLCGDWMKTLLGPFSRFSFRFGALDLTPILFAVAAGAVHALLIRLLFVLYRMLL